MKGLIKIFVTFAMVIAAMVFAPRHDGLCICPVAYAWTRTVTFESGTVGQVATGKSGMDYAGTRTTYSKDTAAVGSKSARMDWVAGDVGWNTCHGEILTDAVASGGEIWFRGYVYAKSPWKWGDLVVKMMRISTNSGMLSIFWGWGNGEVILSNERADVQTNTGVMLEKDKWICLEMYIKFGNPGIFRIWKNGVLAIQDTSHKTGEYTGRILIMSQWNGNAPQNQTEYVDDFIVTTDRPSRQDSHGNYMIGPR